MITEEMIKERISVIESDIEKMSAREYAANEEKITKAMRSGKIIYDLSGNAR